jgi:hypothetical protein
MWRARLFLAGLTLALAGCSSLGGNGQTTEIVTDPVGAECVVAGAGFRQVVRTPDTVAPPLEASPLSVTCTAPGYRDAQGPLRARFDDRIVSNFVLGSSLGVAIDMMNGRDRAYPTTFRIHMEPVSFRTAAARDAWYGRFRYHVAEKWDRAISMSELGCSDGDGETGCKGEVDSLRRGRARELSALESRRAGAVIIGEKVAEEPHPEPRVY